MIEAANWALGNGKDYVLYIGPFQYRDCDTYYDDLFKDWFQTYWRYGLPMRHDNMHYYLNAFPFGCSETPNLSQLIS